MHLGSPLWFQRFQTLVCTEPQQIDKQEVNDLDIQIGGSKFKKNYQWWQKLSTSLKILS